MNKKEYLELKFELQAVEEKVMSALRKCINYAQSPAEKISEDHKKAKADYLAYTLQKNRLLKRFNQYNI